MGEQKFCLRSGRNEGSKSYDQMRKGYIMQQQETQSLSVIGPRASQNLLYVDIVNRLAHYLLYTQPPNPMDSSH